MASSGRPIYSPIRRSNPRRERETNQAAFKYLDEDDGDDGDDGACSQAETEEEARARFRQIARDCARQSADDLRTQTPSHESAGAAGELQATGAPFSANNTRRNLQNHDERQDERQDQQDQGEEEEAEDGRASSVEEVYLCACCGTTKELEPAMEYLAAFRSLLALFNLLALAFGLATLGLGLWFRIDPRVYELHRHLETQNFAAAGWLMLIGGLLASLLALFVGFAASARKSICLLVFYALLMTLLAIGSLATLILLSVFGLGDSLERFLAKEMWEQIRRRSMGAELEDPMGSSEAAAFVDFVQVKLRCCGAQDFRDYQKLGMVIPTTCYTIATNFIQAPGCGQALRELLDLRAGLAAALSAASALAQMLATLLAGLMVCSIYNYRASPRPASATSLAGRPRSRAASRNSSPRELGADSPDQLRPVHLQRPISSYPVRPLSRCSSIEV